MCANRQSGSVKQPSFDLLCRLTLDVWHAVQHLAQAETCFRMPGQTYFSATVRAVVLMPWWERLCTTSKAWRRSRSGRYGRTTPWATSHQMSKPFKTMRWRSKLLFWRFRSSSSLACASAMELGVSSLRLQLLRFERLGPSKMSRCY
ncbi:hypothetical protein TKK_0014693 [Trichogramma kaykai]